MHDLIVAFRKQFVPEIGYILRRRLGGADIRVLCLAFVEFLLGQIDIGSTKIPSSPACAWVMPLLLSVTIAIFMLFSFHGVSDPVRTGFLSKLLHFILSHFGWKGKYSFS